MEFASEYLKACINRIKDGWIMRILHGFVQIWINMEDCPSKLRPVEDVWRANVGISMWFSNIYIRQPSSCIVYCPTLGSNMFSLQFAWVKTNQNQIWSDWWSSNPQDRKVVYLCLPYLLGLTQVYQCHAIRKTCKWLSPCRVDLNPLLGINSNQQDAKKVGHLQMM